MERLDWCMAERELFQWTLSREERTSRGACCGLASKNYDRARLEGDVGEAGCEVGRLESFVFWVPRLLEVCLLDDRVYIIHNYYCLFSLVKSCSPQRPSGLRRGSAADCLLGLRVRIPPEAWMFVCCECPMLSGRGLCDGLIPHPEESYRLWGVLVCDQEQ